MVNAGKTKRILKMTTILGAMHMAGAAMAADVTLQSNDGALKFVGELVDFKDDHYILSTNLGDISIGAAGVTCEGEACPDLEALAAEQVAAATPAEFVGGMVSLQSFDGALKFEGDLIAITDGNYVVRTNLGDLRIATNSVTCVGAACPNVDVVSLEPVAEEPEQAEPETMIVTLQSFDGDLKFIGELLDVTNGKYVIRTNLGELRVSASTVTCDGPACPEIGGEIIETAAAAEPNIEIQYTIAGDEIIGTGMMPLLMSGYAASKNAVVEMAEDPTKGGTVASLVKNDASGEALSAMLLASTSTQDGFKALAAGEAEIAMAARRILPGEAEMLRRSGAGDMYANDQERVIAMDNLMVVLNQSNSLREISVDDLRDIYSGKITTWWPLGGPNAPITVVSHANNTLTRDFFEERILGGQSTAAGVNFVVASSNDEVADLVEANPNAIGYLEFSSLGNTKPVSLETTCGIPSVPDEFSTKTEEYILGRRLYVYNRGDAIDPQAADFLDFAVSENADAMVARAGFINLDVERRVQGAGDPRAGHLRELVAANVPESRVITEMLAQMANFDRLSTTFRFRSGSVNLDEKSRGDMPRLIQYLKDLPSGATVTLVGFADSVGPFASNRSLSVRRADQAAKELLAAADGALDHLNFDIVGYGEVAPSTCNDTAEGRALNRRVEIWVGKNA